MLGVSILFVFFLAVGIKSLPLFYFLSLAIRIFVLL